MGKGGDEKNSSHFEPINYNKAAGEMIVRAVREAGVQPDIAVAHRAVITGRLSSPRSTVLPVVNLAEQHDGTLTNVTMTVSGIAQKPSKVWSCFHKNGMPFRYEGDKVILTLPFLQTADVIVISN